MHRKNTAVRMRVAGMLTSVTSVTSQRRYTENYTRRTNAQEEVAWMRVDNMPREV
jgi:hypothetical protein